MRLGPRSRKAVLLAHIAFSVGWLGAVFAFLALAVVGLTSDDAGTVRGAYLVMEPAAWFALVPLAVGSLVSGLVQSLGSAWGLLRHYWVVFKLLINVFATVALLIYLETFRALASVAADPSAGLDTVRSWSPLLHAIVALFLLLGAMILAVFKPRGLTRRGRRLQRDLRSSRPRLS